MNTQELLAVAELINACQVYNRFTRDAVAAAKDGVPLQLPKTRERKLHVAMVSVRVALDRLHPRILEAMKQVEKLGAIRPPNPVALSA